MTPEQLTELLTNLTCALFKVNKIDPDDALLILQSIRIHIVKTFLELEKLEEAAAALLDADKRQYKLVIDKLNDTKETVN